MKQTQDPNDPTAAAKASVVEDEFLAEAAPDLSQRINVAQEQAQNIPVVAPPMM